MREIVTLAGAACLLTACATASQDVAPSYVSATKYASYSCDQLGREAQAVSAHAAQAAGVQDSNRTSDAVWTGVALVVAWPAIFALKGDNQTTAELARLKGEMQAIEQASIEKNCGIEFRKAPPPPPPPSQQESASRP